jgi:hypothetical protein
VAETRSCGVAEVSTVEAIAGGGRGFLEAKKPEKTFTPWNKTVKEQVEMSTYNEESECGLIKEMKHRRRSILGTFAFHVGRANRLGGSIYTKHSPIITMQNVFGFCLF